MKKIGCDFDGTLIDYGGTRKSLSYINHRLLQQLAGTSLYVFTNQAGLALHMRERAKGTPEAEIFFRSPKDFLDRVHLLYLACQMYDVHLQEVFVALYSPDASLEQIMACIYEFHVLSETRPYLVKTFRSQEYRKPSPYMLQEVPGLTIYYGDDETDKLAAQAGKVPFHHVVRFTGLLPCKDIDGLSKSTGDMTLV